MLSVDEAAAFVSINPATIRRAIDLGHLAAYRIGRIIRIYPADLMAWIGTTPAGPGEAA